MNYKQIVDSIPMIKRRISGDYQVLIGDDILLFSQGVVGWSVYVCFSNGRMSLKEIITKDEYNKVMRLFNLELEKRKLESDIRFNINKTRIIKG